MQAFPPIKLVIPRRFAAPFDHPDWIFELKHDGFRALAYITEGRCDLISRKHNRYKTFNRLGVDLSSLRVQNAIIDGEICCLDDEGRSQFNVLLRRRGEPVFYAFDLLWLNGEDIRPLPLLSRKERLRRLIDRHECSLLLFAQHVPTRGTAKGSCAAPKLRGARAGEPRPPLLPEARAAMIDVAA